MQYVGIQTQQSRNNRRSVFLLFLFPCLVAALLYLACYLLVALGHDESMETGMLEMINPLFINALPYTMGIVLIWFLIAFWMNTSIIKAATGAKPLDRRENKRVYNLVENLCMANGMKTPKINIIDDNSLNAFASGINDRTYTVTLSRGIIQKLNDEELEAVIAHELTHIRNRDVRLLIVSIVFVGIFSMLAQITFYTITHTRIRSNGKNGGGVILIMLIALVIAAVGFFFSRSRSSFFSAAALAACLSAAALFRAICSSIEAVISTALPARCGLSLQENIPIRAVKLRGRGISLLQ